MPHVPDMDKIKPAEFLCDIVDIHACFPSGMFSNYAFFLLRLLPKRTCTTVTPPPSCSCADQIEEGAHVQYRLVRVSAQPVCESTHLFLGDSSLLPEVAVSESDPLEVDPLERPLREELLPEESLLLEPTECVGGQHTVSGARKLGSVCVYGRATTMRDKDAVISKWDV